MADNVTLNPGSAGPVVATDDVGGVQYQRMKLDIGGDGVTKPVVGGLPVYPSDNIIRTVTATIVTSTVLIDLTGGRSVHVMFDLTTAQSVSNNYPYIQFSFDSDLGSVICLGKDLRNNRLVSGFDVMYSGFYASYVFDIDGIDGIGPTTSNLVLTISNNSQLTSIPMTAYVYTGQSSIFGAAREETLLGMRNNLAQPYPGYADASASSYNNYPSLNVDHSGALVTRGAVSTDVGSFRFDGTGLSSIDIHESYPVSINNATKEIFLTGYTVPLSSFVGGSFVDNIQPGGYVFINSDFYRVRSVRTINYNNSATAAVGISYFNNILSTTQTGLLYSRARVFVKGSGTASTGTTIVSGALSGAARGIFREIGAGPIIFKTRLSTALKSNQSTHIGLINSRLGDTDLAFDPTTAKSFARFRTFGAGTVLTETGRSEFFSDAFGVPAGTALQSTTISLPNGLVVTSKLDYSIELLLDKVRFYINDILVSEHTIGIPHPSDYMSLFVGVHNIAVPSSTTTITMDYVSVRNQKRLEVGAFTPTDVMPFGGAIQYDDTVAALALNAVFTGISRDLTFSSYGTKFNSSSASIVEFRVSAEADQTGNLWLEVSRDNINWRRIKYVATTAITGGGHYAEIIHRPSWRYIRVGYTNNGLANSRLTINSTVIS